MHVSTRWFSVWTTKSKIGVREQLQQQGLMGSTVGAWHSSLHAWLIDIDGNVNSWGLLWKLLSGCCVLRVTSNRQQWFHRRMTPWTHFVPIKPDLSDCREKFTGAWTISITVNP